MFKQEMDLNLVGDSSPGYVAEFGSSNAGFDTLITECILNMPDSYDVASSNIVNPSESQENHLVALHDENTADIATYSNQHFQPISPRGPPERKVFSGDLDFQVEINGSDTDKLKYLYSHKLNRIYVDMKISFPVQFRWNVDCAPPYLYVRATTVFSEDSQAEKRVERCTQHTHDNSNEGLNRNVVKNVLHSSREMNAQGVYYCGTDTQSDSWYSVLVELLPTGHATHAYQFVCKNSCSNGINRRAISIIFTLEDSTGHVYGRQTVGARVCSCPRRDKSHDEDGKKGGSKRRITQQPQHALEPKTKRTGVADDDTSYELPPLQIIGRRTMSTGLEVMLSMMEQAASLRSTDPQAVEAYNKSIQDLRKFIDGIKQ
ncbi:cellular tumor antigen p53 isoform X2 [Hyposmocoma kahamanoa]|nr:cellular tumor antigen p53 isoform X2 [Hyposmocoma kahamanoa]